MWSPLTWVYDVFTASIWGGGLKTMADEWEREDVGQLEARISTLDMHLQQTTASLHVYLANNADSFDPFKYVAAVSTAARLSDWIGKPAAEVAVRYRHVLWALEERGEALTDDVDVTEWKAIAEQRLRDLQSNTKFSRAISEALASFEAARKTEKEGIIKGRIGTTKTPGPATAAAGVKLVSTTKSAVEDPGLPIVSPP